MKIIFWSLLFFWRMSKIKWTFWSSKKSIKHSINWVIWMMLLDFSFHIFCCFHRRYKTLKIFKFFLSIGSKFHFEQKFKKYTREGSKGRCQSYKTQNSVKLQYVSFIGLGSDCEKVHVTLCPTSSLAPGPTPSLSRIIWMAVRKDKYLLFQNCKLVFFSPSSHLQ